jgi:hypothetical protein
MGHGSDTMTDDMIFTKTSEQKAIDIEDFPSIRLHLHKAMVHGGPGSGRYPAGSGDHPKSDGSFGGYVSKSEITAYLKASGADDKTIEIVRDELDGHSNNAYRQKFADENIANFWNSDTPESGVLRKMSAIETDAAKAVEAKEGKMMLYRKSSKDDASKEVLSFTTHEEGAQPNPLTEPDFRMTPDISMSLEDLSKNGLHIVSGFAAQRGTGGEGEIIVVRDRPSFSHGGPGSGRYPKGSGGNSSSPKSDAGGYEAVLASMKKAKSTAPTKKQIADQFRGKPQANEHFSRPEVMERIVDYEMGTKDSPLEIGTVIDEDGVVLFSKVGKEGSVPLTLEEHEKVRLMAKNGRVIFTHNHPPLPGSGTVKCPPSENDYNFLREKKGLCDIRAVCKDGTTYLIRPFEGKEVPFISKNQFAGVAFQVKRTMLKEGKFKASGRQMLDKRGNPTNRYYLTSEDVTEYAERTWERSAEIYGFEYRKVK